MDSELIVAFLGGFCVVTTVVLLSGIVVLLRGRTQTNRANALADEMGLVALNPDAGWRTPIWYGGTHQGREFAFASVNVEGGRELSAGAASRVLSWSVAIEVLREAPLPGTPRGTLPESTKAAKKAFRAKYGSLRLGNKAGFQPRVLVPEMFVERDVVAMVTQRGNVEGGHEVLRMVDALADVVRDIET